jgi:hypothetical protein
LFRNSTADAAESCGHIRWIRLVGHYD